MKNLKLKIKKVFLTLLTCYLLPATCNAQTWQWTKLIQPFDNRSGMGVKVSPKDGNLYASGGFNQSIDLGNSHTVTGNNDGFLAKFDTAGVCQWTQHVYVTTQGCGCNVQGNTSGSGIVGFDSQGNLIVAGSYCGCGEEFGGISSNSPGYNLFLAKYNTSGQCLWVKTKAGSYNPSTGQTDDQINAVTIDANDNIYIDMLSYATSSTFCGLSFATQGEYFFKVSTNGVGIWNKQIATTTAGYILPQLKYYNKRVYAVAQYAGTVAFSTHTLTAQGSLDVAALKMDTAGNILAAVDIGATGGQTGALGVVLSNNKMVLLCQAYTNTVSSGTYTLNTGTGMDKTFLIAYDTANLSVQNYRNTATDNKGNGTGLYNDTKGNIYVLATNTATTSFGSLSSVPAGKHIIKMDNTLTNYWHLENTNTCVVPDTLGNLYTVDIFSGSDTYGPFTETATYGITLGKIKNAYTTGMGGRMAQTNNMQVYPNPSSNLFNLKLGSNIKNTGNIKIMLYDISGRLIDNLPFTQADENTLQINLSSYAEGNYLIKAEIDGVLYTAKLER